MQRAQQPRAEAVKIPEQKNAAKKRGVSYFGRSRDRVQAIQSRGKNIPILKDF